MNKCKHKVRFRFYKSTISRAIDQYLLRGEYPPIEFRYENSYVEKYYNELTENEKVEVEQDKEFYPCSKECE